MPYEILNFGPKRYGVVNINTGRIHSAHSSLSDAKKQLKLLRGIEHGFVPKNKHVSYLNIFLRIVK